MSNNSIQEAIRFVVDKYCPNDPAEHREAINDTIRRLLLIDWIRDEVWHYGIDTFADFIHDRFGTVSIRIGRLLWIVARL